VKQKLQLQTEQFALNRLKKKKKVLFTNLVGIEIQKTFLLRLKKLIAFFYSILQ